MATSRLHELFEAGVSPWIDSVSREMLETGELARLMKEDSIVGVTSNPTIFQKALATGDWYDEQLGELLKTEDDPTEIFLQLAMEDIRRACDLMHPVWERTRPCRRLRLDRGRSDARLRPRGDVRAGDQAARRGRQAEPVREDPGDRARPRRDRGLHREGQVDQRDPDLLARALRGRCRGVRPRTGAAGRGRRRSDERQVCRELLRLARRHGGRPPARRDRRPGDEAAAGSWRSRTRSSPTATGRRRSPARAGSSSPARARARSAASGPRRRRRTRSTATSCTSRS